MINYFHHFGITVSNLEEAIHFFHDLLGMEITQIIEREGDRPETIMKMPGVRFRFCVAKTPNNESIELIEYAVPKGKKIDLSTCNPGVSHVAIVVDDIEKLYADLSAKGVPFNSPPYWWQGESVAGAGWGICFLRGPDGIPIELMQPPKQS